MTNELRKIIKTKLATVTNKVYYQVADEDALYPHIVFNLMSVNLPDLNRHDYSLEVNVWTKSAADVEDLADAVETALHAKNFPSTGVLPTFFLESRKTVIDEDKKIKHVLITFVVQTYKKGA